MRRTARQNFLRPKILAEAIDLMHALVQNCHDSDIAVRQSPPVNEMPFVAEEVTIDAEHRRDRFRHHAACLDFLERFEQTYDVPVRLFGTPMIAREAIDFVETVRGRRLDADGQVRFRAMTSAAVSGS